jgi:hypothetical protein
MNFTKSKYSACPLEIHTASCELVLYLQAK